MEIAISKIVPKYKIMRDKGKVVYLTNKEDKKVLRDFLFSEAFFNAQLDSSFCRASLEVNINNDKPPVDLKVTVRPLIEPYMRAYSMYFYKCATEYTPKYNDWWDLEHFYYLQNGFKLLTRDNKWLIIAKESGLEQYLYAPTQVTV